MGHDQQSAGFAAIESGKFKEEITPIPVPQGKGEPLLFCLDERPRKDTSMETLAKLKPVMGGVCTQPIRPARTTGRRPAYL